MEHPHLEDKKQFGVTSTVQDFDDDIALGELPPAKAGTSYDRKDMYRVGKVQEFKVRQLLS